MTSDLDPTKRDQPAGISRRSTLAGAAWATPVVVGLSAAPAVAGSLPPVPPTVAVTVTRTRLSANDATETVNNYALLFTNTGAATTAFSVSFAFTRVSPTGDITGVTPPTGWTASAPTTTALTTTYTITKNDGVLPAGQNTYGFVFTGPTDYVADMIITANPTPGTGASTMSGFDNTIPV